MVVTRNPGDAGDFQAKFSKDFCPNFSKISVRVSACLLYKIKTDLPTASGDCGTDNLQFICVRL